MWLSHVKARDQEGRLEAACHSSAQRCLGSGVPSGRAAGWWPLFLIPEPLSAQPPDLWSAAPGTRSVGAMWVLALPHGIVLTWVTNGVHSTDGA